MAKKIAFFLLVIFEAVLYGQTERPVDEAPDSSPALKRLISDLGSNYFLVRDRAAIRLKELKRKAIPALLDGIADENPERTAGCVLLLDGAVVDVERNSRIIPLVGHPDRRVREAAIRYLASHPAEKDTPLFEKILRDGTDREIGALLAGIRRPAPDWQAERVLAALPRLSSELQAEAINALSRARRVRAAGALAAAFDRIRDGRIPRRLLPSLLDALRDCVTPEALRVIVETRSSPSALVREKSLLAFYALKTHLFRLRDFDGLIALNRTLAALFPRDAETILDLAESILLYGDAHADAAAILEPLAARLAGEAGTGPMLQGAEARAGLALADFRAGRDWRPHLDGLAQELERHPGDYALAMRARILLLEGALTAVGGGDGTPFFLKALEIAPFERFTARIDEFLSGRFSPAGLIWRLSRDGGEEDCLEVYFEVIRSLREDQSNCDYYPKPGDLASVKDTARSGFPLGAAWFLQNDCGDPARATATLTSLLEVVQESTLDVNLDLTARAYFARGAAALDGRDTARAADDVRKGLRICSDLLDMYRAARRKELLHVYDTLVERQARQKALALLQLATIHTMAGDVAANTEALVDEAHLLAPELIEVQVARALVLARAGLTAPAERLVAVVEEYPDQFYNKACLLLLLGRKEEALECLKRHFGDYVRPRRIDLARDWARNDPDLEALRADSRFKKLTRSRR